MRPPKIQEILDALRRARADLDYSLTCPEGEDARQRSNRLYTANMRAWQAVDRCFAEVEKFGVDFEAPE